MTEGLLKRVQMLDVGAIYYFFEVDLTQWGLAEPLRFHCNGVYQQLDVERDAFIPKGDMYYNGKLYQFIGIDIEGIQLSNDGKVNAPSLRVMNHFNGQQGAVSALLLLYNNLVGAKLTFRMTTAEAYDAGILQEEVQYWWIERKLSEDINTVTFELTSPLDFKRQQIPTRLISDLCTWSMRGEYRGESCGYTGTRYFDKRGNTVDSITLDECGGTCNDCLLRFGAGAELPFGGFMIPYRTDF